MVITSNKIAPQDDISAVREAAPQVLASIVKSVLLLGFGMTLGYTTILIPALSDSTVENSFLLGPEAISWVSSVNLICVPIGCMASGAITQAFGRRRSMQITNIPFLVAWILLSYSTAVWQVFLALVITGLDGGLLEAPVITYVAEITQPHLRGMLSATGTIAVILGVLVQFVLGSFYHWRTLALMNCVVPVTAIILLFFVPESPHWLIMKNRFDAAKKAIAWLRGWTTVEKIEPEFKDICRTLGKFPPGGVDNPAFEDNYKQLDKKKKEVQSKSTVLKHFTKKDFINPYLLVIFVFFLGHFTGMTTLQTYAVQIFATLKSPINKYYATIILGVAELLGCIVCMIVIPYTGKRLLNFVSISLCSVCYVIVATYAYMINITHLEIGSSNSTHVGEIPTSQTPNNWIPLTFLIASAFISHTGIRVLPWILTGEVYSNKTRAAASGMSGGASYIMGFLSNKIFLGMISTFTLPGTYWFYSAVGFVGVIVLYFWLPETEGKTLHEINEHFSGKKRMDNAVYRKRKVANGGTSNQAYCDTESDFNKNQVVSRL